jgi:hypothetical protein
VGGHFVSQILEGNSKPDKGNSTSTETIFCCLFVANYDGYRPLWMKNSASCNVTQICGWPFKIFKFSLVDDVTSFFPKIYKMAK